MTTTATKPSASTGSSGASPEENKAAAGFTVLGFMLGGPVGGVIAALAVGIERAFLKSGWEQPNWLGGDKPPLTPEQWAERRAKLAEESRETLREMRERAEARAKVREEHQQRMQDWLDEDKEGDKPDRPEGMHRNPWEFLQDFLAASKSAYRLFDDKMARGNEKITGTYPAIGNFFRNLWNFITGLIEGTREGWRQYQESKKDPEEPAGETDEQTPEPTPDYSWGPEPQGTTDDGPTPEPTPLPPPDGPRPAVDPAPEGADPDPATGSGPIPASEPATPLPAPEPTPLPQGGTGPEQLPTGPAGSGEGTVEGELLSPDNTPVLGAASGAAPAHQNQQGETNLDLIYQAFHPIPPLLRSVAKQMPDLEAQQKQIATRLSWIRTLAGAYGVPTAVWAYLAEGAHVNAALAGGLETIKVDNAMARELADEALIGLEPAREDLATTHAEGASGEIYADAAEVAA